MRRNLTAIPFHRRRGFQSTACLAIGAALLPTMLAGARADAHTHPAAANARTAASTLPTLKIIATDFAFAGPEKTKGGAMRVELTNAGKQPHHVLIVRITGTRSYEDIQAIANQGSSYPSWFTAFGGTGSVAPGQTGSAFVDLPTGSYALLCVLDDAATHKDHGHLGMVRRLTVTAPATTVRVPTADATIIATDYTFTATGLSAGTHNVALVNQGREIHHVILAPLGDGHTLAEVSAFLLADASKPPTGPPPVDFTKSVEIQAIDPGKTVVAPLALAKGTYAAFCFVHDRAGGPPHLVKGMISALTVS